MKRFIIQILTICTLATALLPSFPLLAQKKAVAGKPVAATNTKTAAKEKIDLSSFVPVPIEKTMSAAFSSGSLPAAAAMPEGLPAIQASELAESISNRDENSTASLIAALKFAGYGIRDEAGNVDFDQSGWQGMAVDHWEIAYLAKQYGDGAKIGLGRFADSLGVFFPEWKRDDNSARLVNSIRGASFSQSRPLQAWSNLIIELGRRSATPYDLRSDVDILHAKLDIVQIYLILTRLAGDLKALQVRSKIAASNTEVLQDARRRGVQRMVGAAERIEAVTPDEKLPCTLAESDLLFLDVSATVMNAAYADFTKILEDTKVISKTPGAVMGGMNAALIALKLIMTYATLDADIKLDADLLTRTKTMADGEKRKMTAKVRLDIGKWQIANCVRPFLNSAGIDFSLPADGALANVRVDWMLESGGQSWGSRIDNLTGDSFDSDQLVYLDWQPYAQKDDKGKYFAYTDGQGIAQTDVVGYRQKNDLSSKLVKPVIKKIEVYLDIQVKTMKIKTAQDAAGTANDLAGNAISFWTGDLPGMFAGTAAETAYRSPYGYSKKHSFPVKDWIPCNGGWSGKITYRKVQFNNSIYEHRDGRMNSLKYFTAGREVDQYDGRINVVAGAGPELLNAFGTVTYRRSMFRYQRADGNTSCGNKTGSIRPSSHETHQDEQFVASGSGNSDVNISMHSNGVAMINFRFPDAEGEFAAKSSSSWSGGCRPTPPSSNSNKKPYSIGGELYTIDQIPIDPESPDVLKGTRRIKGEHGRELIVTWELTRCSGGK